jgi:membrane protein implicated in regulation of membrane protease activity
MDAMMVFHAAHPFWVWLALAAIILAVEVGTGSGWLLWPAASAGAVGLLSLVAPLGLPVEVALFAVLTMATTFLARRYLRPASASDGPDLNDPMIRLVGHEGEVLSGFTNGHGRVFIDGKEWAAVAQDGLAPAAGQRVMVVAVEGAVLTVR